MAYQRISPLCCLGGVVGTPEEAVERTGDALRRLTPPHIQGYPLRHFSIQQHAPLCEVIAHA